MRSVLSGEAQLPRRTGDLSGTREPRIFKGSSSKTKQAVDERRSSGTNWRSAVDQPPSAMMPATLVKKLVNIRPR